MPDTIDKATCPADETFVKNKRNAANSDWFFFFMLVCEDNVQVMHSADETFEEQRSTLLFLILFLG
jgi:hypothetical protein